MAADIPHGIHSPRLHVIMYSLLLIATPFILLQNFLIEKISELSGTTIEINQAPIPLMPIIAVVVLVAMLFCCRGKLTWLRSGAGVLVLAMNALAQQVTDYYFGHNFYDLQQNWHYLAYGLFAYMVYRDLKPRGVPPARIMLITYLVALGLSTFDELFQMQMSSRVFDVSDIAKDVWGTLMGIVFIYLVTNPPGDIKKQWRRIWQRRLVAYLNHQPGLLILLTAFGAMFIVFGSLLTEFDYCHWAAVFGLSGLVVFWAIFHFSQFVAVRASLLVLGILLVGWLSYSYFTHRHEGVSYTAHGLTVYRGLPIPFFDIMIRPDGSFRPVDKKHYFNRRDQEFFKRQGADIVIVSTGTRGEGGRGFSSDEPVLFDYNQIEKRPLQIMRLGNREACGVFDRLRKEGRRVLLVLHTSG